MTHHDEIRRTLATLVGQLHKLQQDFTELTASPNLDQSIDAWVATRTLATELKDTKTVLDGLVAAMTDEAIPEQLKRHGVTSVTHRLGKVTLTHHTKASIIPNRKAEAYAWLHANDLGALIIQTVNAQTLSAAAKELVLNGSDLPRENFTVSFRQYANFTPKG